MFERIIEAIRTHDPIILHRHAHPDGDALGSQIGLKHLIQDNYPGKKVYVVGDAPERYSFMTDTGMDEIDDSVYQNALAVVLDTSDERLISDERYKQAKTTVRMDHHLFIGKIAEFEAVDSSYESCCGLVTMMAMENGWTLSSKAATALYTGMVTDSGRFRYNNTSAHTFRLAAFLMSQKIDTDAIYRELYAVEFAQMKLRAEFTMKIAFTAHNVAYIYTTRDEVERSGADAFAVSRGMVSTMADIRGVDIWVNFTESGQGILCELRSNRLNINPIAVRYGGGGHAAASGATVKTRAEAMQLLDDLDQMMAEG